MSALQHLALTSIATLILFACAGAACSAQQAPEETPSPSASATPTESTPASPAPSPSASPESTFYQMDGDIFEAYNINRDGQYYYYFQGNQNGTAKVKNEIRYGRNLWTDPAQIKLRIPIITRYPTEGNPYSGLGNIELGYSYNVTAKTFDHSLEARVAFPTAANGVESLDTQLKGFYNLKWKWAGGSIAYTNEYDQTIIRPPGSSNTSYYEGKLTLPEYAFKNIKGLKFSAIYNFRVLFDSGGIYKSAAGGTLFGNINKVGLLIVDTWGIGGNGLWKYKFEFNASAKF